MQEVKRLADALRENVSKVIVGAEDTIDLLLSAVLAGGHILIEDKPGTGKTMLAKAFAKSMDGSFRRVQFTPDLLPSDITGLNVYNQKLSEFTLVKGPVFTNVFLADEINRATPRTQSSLLEAMEEFQVTIDGETLPLPSPFVVIATENPIETIGTYPLPEAQLDRFLMKLDMGNADREHELSIIESYLAGNSVQELSAVCGADELTEGQRRIKTVFVHDCIRNYIVDIVMATRSHAKIKSGVSTRGVLAMIRCAQAYAAIKGRNYVEPDDVKKLAPYVLGHRMDAYRGGAEYTKNCELIREIVGTVTVPVEDWEK